MSAKATVANKKKKKHGCLKAFLITLLVSVIVLALLIVIGLFVGNSIMKDQLGVGLFDVIGAVQDFGNYDENELITNKFDESDAAAFYDSLNKSMFFADGTDGGEAVITSEYMQGMIDLGFESMDDAMLDLLDIDNFDKDALSEYDGTADDYMSQLSPISDKQLGAFINELVFESNLINFEIGTKQFTDFITTEQIILRRGANMPQQFEAIETQDEHVYLIMTCSVQIEDLVFEMLADLPGIAKWGIGLFLPQKTYITLVADLNDADYGFNIEVNALSNEISKLERTEKNGAMFDKYADENGKVTKMERLLIVAQCLAGVDLESMINDAIGGVAGYLCASDTGFSVGNMISLDTVDENGNFKTDMFGMFAKLINESSGGDATANDVIVLLQSLACTDGQQSIDTAAGARVTSSEQADEYGNEFTAAVGEAYGIPETDKSFDDVVSELLTQGSDNTGNSIMDFLTGGSEEVQEGTGVVEVTDRMLAAMIYDLMNDSAAPEFTDEGVQDFNLTLEALAIRKEGEKDFADMVLSLDISKLIGDVDMFANMLPEVVTITMRADITPKSDAEDATITAYNNVSKEGGTLHGLTVDDLFGAFSAIMPDFRSNIDTICEKFAAGVRSVINNLEQSLAPDADGNEITLSFVATEDGGASPEVSETAPETGNSDGSAAETEKETVSGETVGKSVEKSVA